MSIIAKIVTIYWRTHGATFFIKFSMQSLFTTVIKITTRPSPHYHCLKTKQRNRKHVHS